PAELMGVGGVGGEGLRGRCGAEAGGGGGAGAGAWWCWRRRAPGPARDRRRGDKRRHADGLLVHGPGAQVRASGAEIVRELRDEDWGVRRFFVRDPTGRVVNVQGVRRPASLLCSVQPRRSATAQEASATAPATP